MKKKILFAYPELIVGGSTTSLISLLNSIDFKSYDVDLVLYKWNPELVKDIPNDVNIIGAVSKFNKGRVFDRTKLLFIYFIKGYLMKALYFEVKYKKRIGFNSQVLSKAAAKESKSINKHYDVAIGYLEYWANDYIVDKIKANKKIAWIHTDYLKAKYIPKLDESLFYNADKIIHVVEECMNNFNHLFPLLTSKSMVIHNITSPKLIRAKAKEDISCFANDFIGFKIITVCRLDTYTKGIDRIISISNKLHQSGYRFKWYIVGDGKDRNKIKEMISEYKLGNIVILLGKKMNPFPYVRKSDLFCLPSRYEGKPISVTESQILGVPPLVTNYSSAKKQVINNKEGLVVENDEESLYLAIIELMKRPDLLAQFRDELLSKDYGNECEVYNFYNLLL